LDTDNLPPLDQQMGSWTLAAHPYAVRDKIALQRGCHLSSVVGDGEDPPAALHHGANTPPLKKDAQVVDEEPRESTIQEASRLTKVRDELRELGHVCDIAASLAGQAQLVTQARRLLQQQHIRTAFRGTAGSHHT